MKSFKKYIDAENYAKEVSAKELKSISIVHLFQKKDFTVMDKPNEWQYGISHVMSIHNFATPFEVHSKSPRSGIHIEAFPTKEFAQKRYDKLIQEKYRQDVFMKDLTPEEHYEKWVKTSDVCKNLHNEYRQKLLLM